MPGLVLGDFRITLVRQSVYWWDGGALFGVVPKTLWGSRTESDELNRIPLAFNCYLIETGDRTILIETGAGDKPDTRARERARVSDAPLLHQVLDAARIDVVINSHLHWDHCGGNTVLEPGGARAAFPNARYYTRRGEWEHAHERHPRDTVSYVDANYDPLVDAGRMQLLDEDAEVVPGIRLIRAPGHTWDMAVVTAASGGRTFCFLSDLVPTAAHITPTWVTAFDLFPLKTIASKTYWLGQAAREGWVCGFAHDTRIDFAEIREEDSRFRVQPL